MPMDTIRQWYTIKTQIPYAIRRSILVPRGLGGRLTWPDGYSAPARSFIEKKNQPHHLWTSTRLLFEFCWDVFFEAISHGFWGWLDYWPAVLFGGCFMFLFLSFYRCFCLCFNLQSFGLQLIFMVFSWTLKFWFSVRLVSVASFFVGFIFSFLLSFISNRKCPTVAYCTVLF